MQHESLERGVLFHDAAVTNGVLVFEGLDNNNDNLQVSRVGDNYRVEAVDDGGNDTLTGDAGRDLLEGQSGNDVLSALDGEIDTLSGGSSSGEWAEADENDAFDSIP